MSIRIDFDYLFTYDEEGLLQLKRKLIINNQQYNVGDKFVDESFNFPFDNPKDYFYIINRLRVGDTLKGWFPLE